LLVTGNAVANHPDGPLVAAAGLKAAVTEMVADGRAEDCDQQDEERERRIRERLEGEVRPARARPRRQRR
jgi:hypothetical protein